MIQFLLLHKIQIISIFGSLLLFVFIIQLIQQKKLKEEYSIIWIAFSLAFLGLSVFRPLLDQFAEMVGIHYPPAALLLFLIVAIICVLIQFSLVVSRLTERNKVLVQELAILQKEFKDFKNEKEP